MKGLIIEGGGRRGIFAAGVLDRLVQNNISFDYIIGISSGAQAALNFVAGQSERTKKIIIPQKEGFTGVGLKKMFGGDLKKMVYEYPYGRLPFDFKAFFESDIITEIVATDCATGLPEYFREKSDETRLMEILRASCSLPVLYSKVKIDGKEYLDGSIADALPYERAFSQGCDKLLVVMSKPVTEQATDYNRYHRTMQMVYKNYPNLTKRLFDRLERYNAQAAAMQPYIDEGRIMTVRPERTLVGTFEMNRDKLEKGYQYAYDYAGKQIEAIKEFLQRRVKSMRNAECGMRN